METALFDRTQVSERADPPTIIAAVAAAFIADVSGNTAMPAKTYLDLISFNGDFRAMPAYVKTEDWEAAGVKWVNVHPDNPAKHGLPTVMGIMLYSDPETAVPLAVMDGTELTRQRTGAAAAIATDHLARENARSLGIIGAGAQSYAQVEYISTVRPIETIVICDRNQDAVSTFCDHFSASFSVRVGTPAEAASCDILSTLTPVREPLISRSALDKGAHINAIGADAPGKQELDADILVDGKVFIDDYEQSIHSGEVNVPWSDGTIQEDDIDGTLGSVVAGTRDGRTSENEITIFDSTGLAIQDVAAAHVIYEAGSASDSFDFLELD